MTSGRPVIVLIGACVKSTEVMRASSSVLARTSGLGVVLRGQVRSDQIRSNRIDI